MRFNEPACYSVHKRPIPGEVRAGRHISSQRWEVLWRMPGFLCDIVPTTRNSGYSACRFRRSVAAAKKGDRRGAVPQRSGNVVMRTPGGDLLAGTGTSRARAPSPSGATCKSEGTREPMRQQTTIDSVPFTQPKRLNYFERYLTVWVGACMLIGVLVGRALPGVVDTLRRLEFRAGAHQHPDRCPDLAHDHPAADGNLANAGSTFMAR